MNNSSVSVSHLSTFHVHTPFHPEIRHKSSHMEIKKQEEDKETEGNTEKDNWSHQEWEGMTEKMSARGKIYYRLRIWTL